MTAPFRLTDQKPQYRVALGSIAANGRILFYATGTSTPKNVYTDPTLGTSLGATIALDADGRHSEDIWMDGEYRIDVQDADDVSIPGYPLDYVRNPASSTSLVVPDATAGSDGQVLATDGTAGGWFFVDLPAIPTQTGNQGKYLTTDGESLSFAAFPEAADIGVSATPASKRKWTNGILEQWGSGTAPSAAALTTSVAIAFGKPFDSAVEHVDITPVLSAGVTSNSPSGFPTWSYSSPSTTGCTAHFFVGEENTGGSDTISSSIPFTYKAIGPCAVDPDA